MRLYLIRHGQTDNNTLHTIGGMRDFPLNSHGISQANELCRKFDNKNISAVFTSGLSRAMMTGDILARSKGLKPICDTRLNEIDFGEWTGKDFLQIGKEYPELYHTWINDWKNFVAPGGEAVVDVYNRIKEFFLEIASNYEGKQVALVSHQGSLCILASILLGFDKLTTVKIRNTGCVCIDVDPDMNRMIFLNYFDD